MLFQCRQGNRLGVPDRFHVQKLAVEALQDIRIRHHWEAIEAENEAIEQAKKQQTQYQPEVLPNGDSLKQLLARSRYVLYKKPKEWTLNQQESAQILFERFSDIERAYRLMLELSNVFDQTTDKLYGLNRLAKWHENIRQAGFKDFNTVAKKYRKPL